jgi:hypothetical protein
VTRKERTLTGKQSMTKGTRNTADFDVEQFLQPSTAALKDALGALLSGEVVAAEPVLVVSATPSGPAHDLRIARLRTRGQHGDTSVFRRDEHALVLIIDIAASAEVIAGARRFRANFQIVNRATNQVERDFWSEPLTFGWGTTFWVSLGNDGVAGKPTTPAWWGLRPGLYEFRAAIEMETALFACAGDVLFRVR